MASRMLEEGRDAAGSSEPLPDQRGHSVPDATAYFITFTCYGTHLHGDDRGSVDLDHNVYGTPVLPPDVPRFAGRRQALTHPPYELAGLRPWIVRDAIVALAGKRGWTLWAAHVRTEHLHAVVTAPGCDIHRAMNDLKAAGSF